MKNWNLITLSINKVGKKYIDIDKRRGLVKAFESSQLLSSNVDVS